MNKFLNYNITLWLALKPKNKVLHKMPYVWSHRESTCFFFKARPILWLLVHQLGSTQSCSRINLAPIFVFYKKILCSKKKKKGSWWYMNQVEGFFLYFWQGQVLISETGKGSTLTSSQLISGSWLYGKSYIWASNLYLLEQSPLWQMC